MTAGVHPRPQLTRSRWIDLNGQWQFAYDDTDAGVRESWPTRSEVFDRTIVVPFPPESPLSGVGERSFHPILWYRRSFSVTPSDRSARLLLHFGAVDYRADVWLNGRRVAHHEGGHTPFTADISDALIDGEEQIVVVRAEDRPEDMSQPRGKQYWHPDPEEVWYHRTSGIWQTVWLEPVPSLFIREIRWTPDVDRGRLGVEVTLDSKGYEPLLLRVRVALRDEVLIDDVLAVKASEVRRELEISTGVPSMTRSRQLVWSPEHPNLMQAELTLIKDGLAVDVVQSYVGFRSVTVDNGHLMLNGWPYYLRMVMSQGYWPESHLAAPSGDALRRDVELIKSLGFNGVRLHQKIEDPRFLYWCDRLGLVVWTEMPSAYVFSNRAVERLTREWLEVLQRDYNHPSIILWVPFNESWGVPALPRSKVQQSYVRAIYHLTHALDATRPVIGNDGWEHVRSDIWGVHDYAFDGDTLLERYGNPEALERTIRDIQPSYHSIAMTNTRRHGEPVMLTECGGVILRNSSDLPSFGYGVVKDADALAEKYEELIAAITACDTIAGFCYTQLTDVEQENNGLLTGGRFPKADVKRVRAITSRISKAVPGEIVMKNIEDAADAFSRPDGDGKKGAHPTALSGETPSHGGV